jgi:hypothetical protein
MLSTNKVSIGRISEYKNNEGITIGAYPVFENCFFNAVNSANTTGINSSVTWTDLPWDTENRKDAIYTHSTVTNNEEIQINQAGDYEIICEILSDVTSGGNRTITEGRLVIMNGTTTTEIPSSRTNMYNRTSGAGGDSGTISLVHNISANEKVKAQIKRQTGTNNCFVNKDGTRILLRKL